MWDKLPVFLVLFVSLSAIYSSVAYYATSELPSQPFMSLGVYSKNGLQQYIADNNLTIKPPQTTSWTVQIGNMMKTAEYESVLIRLGNSTTQSSNSTTPATSVPELTEMPVIIGVDQTVELNFTWTIQSANTTSGLVYLTILINGHAPNGGQSQLGAKPGSPFRLIFELWTFDTTSKSLQYGYPGATGNHVGEWLQVWFYVN